MKSNSILWLILSLMLATTCQLQAQEDRNRGIIQSALYGLEYEIKAGFNIGGTSPIPLPQEIRALTGYSPNINFSIEGDIIKWLGKEKEWGVILGLRLENKGMEAEARTKNYSMEIIGSGGERMKGNWTGMVKTKFRASYFTIPVLAAWKANPRLRFNFGPYFSIMTNNKVEFEGETTAPYDFSDNLRHFQWGMQGGVSWRAFKHLTVNADLTWGLNDVFKKDFQTITFPMYPIYLNAGFGYAF